MKLRILRGERINQALDEDATYSQLRQNIDTAFPETNKRQHATAEVNVSNIQYVPFTNGALQVDAISRSNGHDYKQTLIFSGVNYHPTEETGTATFTGTDGEQHDIEPISLQDKRVKVGCTCLDFHYRFATWNHAADALSTKRPPMYQRKTNNRPPVNPTHAPGVCKHIIRVIDTMRKYKLIR